MRFKLISLLESSIWFHFKTLRDVLGSKLSGSELSLDILRCTFCRNICAEIELKTSYWEDSYEQFTQNILYETWKFSTLHNPSMQYFWIKSLYLMCDILLDVTTVCNTFIEKLLTRKWIIWLTALVHHGSYLIYFPVYGRRKQDENPWPIRVNYWRIQAWVKDLRYLRMKRKELGKQCFLEDNSSNSKK